MTDSGVPIPSLLSTGPPFPSSPPARQNSDMALPIIRRSPRPWVPIRCHLGPASHHSDPSPVWGVAHVPPLPQWGGGWHSPRLTLARWLPLVVTNHQAGDQLPLGVTPPSGEGVGSWPFDTLAPIVFSRLNFSPHPPEVIDHSFVMGRYASAPPDHLPHSFAVEGGGVAIFLPHGQVLRIPGMRIPPSVSAPGAYVVGCPSIPSQINPHTVTRHLPIPSGISWGHI